MILTDKAGAGEVTEVESLDFRRTYVCIGEGLFARFHSQRAQVAVRERPERSLADSDHGDRSHILFRIPRADDGFISGIRCTFVAREASLMYRWRACPHA